MIRARLGGGAHCEGAGGGAISGARPASPVRLGGGAALRGGVMALRVGGVMAPRC